MLHVQLCQRTKQYCNYHYTCIYNYARVAVNDPLLCIHISAEYGRDQASSEEFADEEQDAASDSSDDDEVQDFQQANVVPTTIEAGEMAADQLGTSTQDCV